ncbi:3'-5' exonuclease [Emticicia agri]|uniref:3'-5' exonuclease n=1 Tax=Emticicia agri TaxID=2492393 RepID=A0A4Q5LYI8_9BACT|nr:3'-5' exonuclease [Emticicia agri]RYU94715.1 3'-5' exonuclease [Emticicia agri]
MRKILFFDTETTGLPNNYNAPITAVQNWPRMVQLAFLVFREDGSLDTKHNYIIKPEGYVIPADATRIHRITTQQALTEGHDLTQVLTLFQQAVSESAILIGHNVEFDKAIAGAECIRKKIDTKALLATRSFCTMKDKNIVNFCKIPGKYGFKWPTLEELHFRLFKEQIKEAHDASIDIESTAKCFFELLKRRVVK